MGVLDWLFGVVRCLVRFVGCVCLLRVAVRFCLFNDLAIVVASLDYCVVYDCVSAWFELLIVLVCVIFTPFSISWFYSCACSAVLWWFYGGYWLVCLGLLVWLRFAKVHLLLGLLVIEVCVFIILCWLVPLLIVLFW